MRPVYRIGGFSHKLKLKVKEKKKKERKTETAMETKVRVCVRVSLLHEQVCACVGMTGVKD